MTGMLAKTAGKLSELAARLWLSKTAGSQSETAGRLSELNKTIILQYIVIPYDFTFHYLL